MKYCHLLTALALVGCGLDTAALPTTGRGADAGVGTSEPRVQAIAGSPANWPTRRRRGSSPAKDGGSAAADTKDASSAQGGSKPSAKPEQDAQANPTGQTNPGAQANPGGQSGPSSQSPSKAGQSTPGAQASGGQSQQPSGSSNTGNTGSSAAVDAGLVDAGWTPSADAGDISSGQPGSGNGGQQGSGSQPPSNGGAPASNEISVIVDLVLAILDLSLGPVRPSELEGLVSAILVLSFAPADLAADALIAVFDALEDTRICVDHPERCNPLCTNLESDCSACGRDDECIERIEEMCNVRLPRSCR